MRFLTMWYVRPTKAQTSLYIVQSDQSLCFSLEYSTTLRLLAEHHLEFISFLGSSESTLVKMLEITCHGSDVVFQFFSLTLECADEDGMRYRSIMSSLLQEYGGVGIFVKAMHKLTLKRHRLIRTFDVRLNSRIFL